MNDPIPQVYTWFRVYTGAFALLYLLVAGVGIFFLVAGNSGQLGSSAEATEATIMGVLYLALGGILFVPFFAALFLPKKPWVWIFDLILIGIGLTSPCCMLASIPLLIYWLKPETKALFGRE